MLSLKHFGRKREVNQLFEYLDDRRKDNDAHIVIHTEIMEEEEEARGY